MKTILLLEDDFQLAMFWKESLEVRGHVVEHVVDYESALPLLEEKSFDLVIADMLIRDQQGDLKKSGGLSLLSHLRLNIQPCPPFIAVSGATPQVNILGHASVLKADLTLAKPVTVDTLVRHAEELMGGE